MGKGKKTGGRNFSTGRSGNVKGRPALPPEIKQAREVLGEEFQNNGLRCWNMTVGEVQTLIKDPKAKSGELLVAGIFAKALSGSVPHTEILFERLLPPPSKEPIAQVQVLNVNPEFDEDKVKAALSKFKKDL